MLIEQINTPDSVLRTPTRPLTLEEIKSPEIQALIQSMKEAMRAAPGVGLAAPQVGHSIQLAVIEDPEERQKMLPKAILDERNRKIIDFHVIINPKIIHLSEELEYYFEGCLSIEKKTRITPRSKEVIIECLNEKGEPRTIKAQGWYARILQHEIDHLYQILYIDRAHEGTEETMDDDFMSTWFSASKKDIYRLHLQSQARALPHKKIASWSEAALTRLAQGKTDKRRLTDVLHAHLAAMHYSFSHIPKLNTFAEIALKRLSDEYPRVIDEKYQHFNTNKPPTILAHRVAQDLIACVYKQSSKDNNEIHDIAFFKRRPNGHLYFTHSYDLKELAKTYLQKKLSPTSIRQIGDAILHQPGKSVTDFTPEEKKILEEQLSIMKQCLYSTGGVGIAANQCNIDEPRQLIISGVDYNNPEHVIKAITRYPSALFPPMKVLVNPRIINTSESQSNFPEGCLSVRGILRGNVLRPSKATVAYQDIDGNAQEISVEGEAARVMLHELDHILNGRVYLQQIIEALTHEQKLLLKEIIEDLKEPIASIDTNSSFSSPILAFERDKNGSVTFNSQKVSTALSQLPKDTLEGIFNTLKASLNQDDEEALKKKVIFNSEYLTTFPLSGKHHKKRDNALDSSNTEKTIVNGSVG